MTIDAADQRPLFLATIDQPPWQHPDGSALARAMATPPALEVSPHQVPNR